MMLKVLSDLVTSLFHGVRRSPDEALRGRLEQVLQVCRESGEIASGKISSVRSDSGQIRIYYCARSKNAHLIAKLHEFFWNSWPNGSCRMSIDPHFGETNSLHCFFYVNIPRGADAMKALVELQKQAF